MSDDEIAIFKEHIAFTSVAQAFEPIESFVDVKIQVLTQTHAANVEFCADVFVTVALGFQIQGHHPTAYDGMFMLQSLVFQLQDVVFRELNAFHQATPLLGSLSDGKH